jgi:hypothetical protein
MNPPPSSSCGGKKEPKSTDLHSAPKMATSGTLKTFSEFWQMSFLGRLLPVREIEY